VSVLAIDTFPAVTTATVADGVAGTSYSATIGTTGRPAPTVSLSAGALPAGLALANDGTLSGTPTAAGSFTFTVTAASSVSGISSTAEQTLTITIAPRPQALLSAGDDDFTGAAVSASGGVTGNVLGNDTLNGTAVNPAEVSLTLTDSAGIQGASLADDGTLTLPAGVAAGTYTLTYQLCERADLDNCVDAGVVVRVLAAEEPRPQPEPQPEPTTAPIGNSRGSGALAVTGSSSVLPAVGVAALLMLFGATALVVRRRTRSARG
jgi:hypothetical protein